jgi:hypothetical protein
LHLFFQRLGTVGRKKCSCSNHCITRKMMLLTNGSKQLRPRRLTYNAPAHQFAVMNESSWWSMGRAVSIP